MPHLCDCEYPAHVHQSAHVHQEGCSSLLSLNLFDIFFMIDFCSDKFTDDVKRRSGGKWMGFQAVESDDHSP